MIYNITHDTFGAVRMGDIIGIANIVEHLRKSSPFDLKFYLRPESIDSSAYVHQFKDWMITNTDYFSADSGTYDLPWKKVNVWDYRDIAGDVVQIKNNEVTDIKVTICPLIDAKYNTYRNWPKSILEKVFELGETEYSARKKVICISPDVILPFYPTGSKWEICTDLYQTLHHIKTSQVYIGGDTGLSHFAGSLDRGPEPIYYTSSRGLLHTTPMHWMTNKKGTMRTYWLDFEGTTWK